MSIAFTRESELEAKLIDQLTKSTSQWTRRDDLKTQEDLWNNVREKINQNNLARLDGKPLTDAEFNQVRNKLTFANPYEAAGWMRGENGVARVKVQRKDATQGDVYLEVMNSNNIAGGRSSYEVISQYEADKMDGMDRNRRFDVTLLINGLPMIHIELKSAAVSYMEAFRQIKKYQSEGKMKGIFSSVQMFVVTNGTDTRYIAAALGDNLRETFLTTWVDVDNKPVNNYLAFAKEVLSIPQAHKMVAHYSVIDESSKNILLLRPYQIHAIEAIQQASRNRESGYVWHTTGSGKTLTSYKTAGNLYEIPSVDKSVFIVDRVDLDQQTTSSFESYAAFDKTEIDSTANVSELIRKLKSNDRSVIVTTIQKLNHVMRRLEEDSKTKELITNKRIAFVVDEAHRAVTPQKQDEINRFFKQNTMWFGFTGTPIFAENARDAIGNLARTTKEQYTQLLHQYTVKEAIHDKNVLGFQIHYLNFINEWERDHFLEEFNPDLNLDELTALEKEQLLPREVFETDDYMWQVVDYIVNKSGHLLGVRKGEGRSYSGLLTTTSIAQAQRYYEMFQQVKNGTAPIKVKESIKRYLSDFPKVAITYSISENEEASVDNQEKMKQSIADYNEMFGTNFTLETISSYNQNLNQRLARKASRYKRRDEQLDIVIVVDRLLTGFDAPTLSTLFIDRPPQPPHALVQALSRTNRLYEADKKYGQIVTMRTPEIYQEKIKEALFLYSNGGENDVLAPTWEETKACLLEAVQELRQIAPASDFYIEHMDEVELKKFAKAFQQLDKHLAAIQVYDEFEPEMMQEVFHISEEEVEAYHGKYVNVLEVLRTKDEAEDIYIDIEYELQSVHVAEINYEYILNLLQSFVPQTSDESVLGMNQKQEEEISKHIEELEASRPQLAELVKEILKELKENPQALVGQDLMQLFQQRAYEHRQMIISDLSESYALNKPDVMNYVRQYHPDQKERPHFDPRESMDYEAYKERTEKPLAKLRAYRVIREEIADMVEKELYPYQI
ncbi:type I restriction endonuclease subunit R [Dolosicoccus paucivorans]|uniref:type I restriction endonuclease subunit R n=1 Tax=Dolosicoccus paucivorans TaxID=84521 RepID=UPI0008834143|nr:type I restriction endonuclease subunit R [Dolosicoccus paucivorans]SDI53252.1 type I restriction enzyme, R subunit [Dolosicoccus paucivorans]